VLMTLAKVLAAIACVALCVAAVRELAEMWSEP
jgi:hypothetical protein